MIEPGKQAEFYCLTLMGRRAKAMAFYITVFGFTVLLLNDPDYLDAFTAACLVGFYGLISAYYLILSVHFTRHRFDFSLAGIQDETTRRLIRRENDFRRIAHGIFIVLSFLFIVYLGM